MRRERIIRCGSSLLRRIVGGRRERGTQVRAPQAPAAQASGQPVPSVTVLGSRAGGQAFSAGRCAAARTRTSGASSTSSSIAAGQVRAAVIDFGGFLGVGSRKIAVDWNALDFAADGDKRDVVTLELTRDQVKAAPEYKDQAAPSSCSEPQARCIRRRTSDIRFMEQGICVSLHAPSVGRLAFEPDQRGRIARRSPARIAAASLAAKPARPRLVRVLRRRRADRIRPVRLGLSDDAEVDAGRYRPGAVDRRHRRRCSGRCRAARSSMRRGRERLVAGDCAERDHRERAGLCVAADLSRRASPPRRCMPRRAACSGPASWRSASAWSAMRRSASGSGAMRASPRIGNGIAAAAMGALGYFFSAQAVFFVTAALLIPTLFALSHIRPREIDPCSSRMAALAAARPEHRAPTSASCCASVRCSSSPAASRCSIWPMPRCCR